MKSTRSVWYDACLTDLVPIAWFRRLLCTGCLVGLAGCSTRLPPGVPARVHTEVGVTIEPASRMPIDAASASLAACTAKAAVNRVVIETEGATVTMLDERRRPIWQTTYAANESAFDTAQCGSRTAALVIETELGGRRIDSRLIVTDETGRARWTAKLAGLHRVSVSCRIDGELAIAGFADRGADVDPSDREMRAPAAGGFVARVGPGGQPRFARFLPGYDRELDPWVAPLVDAAGGAYVAHYFEREIDADPGPGSRRRAGRYSGSKPRAGRPTQNTPTRSCWSSRRGSGGGGPARSVPPRSATIESACTWRPRQTRAKWCASGRMAPSCGASPCAACTRSRSSRIAVSSCA